MLSVCVSGGSNGVINFPWIQKKKKKNLCNTEFCPCLALPEYIRALIHLACLPVFSVTPRVIVYRLWNDKDKVIGFKRSHWIHLGWWSTGSPKLQLFQLSQHSHATNCRLISSSAYFPWNTTLKCKMQFSEGSWDKILHSMLRTLFFEGGNLGGRGAFVSQRDTPKFQK